jgi:hypothetical protein
MPKKPKEPTIPELQKSIRQSFRRWDQIRRRGAGDLSNPDGVNMYLVRNHILIDQTKLRAACKEQKVRPCPEEAKRKAPRQVSMEFCAPKSSSGPCKERRARRRRKRKGHRRRGR